ncbi:MAG: class I SAM-dependent methyltransferase [Myxococcota bacterium]
MDILELPTREGYDRWADTYDTKPNPLIALDELALTRRMEELRVKPSRAVDLGCGTGRNTYRLLEAGADVTAVDFSERMMDVARRHPRAPRVRFCRHDLTEPLPFEDAAFDVVVCALVLEHVAHLPPLFREIRRICERDGWIHLSDLHPVMRLRDGQAQFSDRHEGLEVRPKGYEHNVSDYVMAVVQAGFELVRMEEHFVTPSLTSSHPKAEKHLGWPMLLSFLLKPGERRCSA